MSHPRLAMVFEKYQKSHPCDHGEVDRSSEHLTELGLGTAFPVEVQWMLVHCQQREPRIVRFGNTPTRSVFIGITYIGDPPRASVDSLYRFGPTSFASATVCFSVYFRHSLP